jgi:hypothetical protein
METVGLDWLPDTRMVMHVANPETLLVGLLLATAVAATGPEGYAGIHS